MRSGEVARFCIMAVLTAGCGGPGKPVDPGPTQSVEFYFAGTEATGSLHFHVNWTQTGHNLVLRSPCPTDTCDVYPYTPVGETELGNKNVVQLASGSGTFADPGITFTITTTDGKTFTFTGNVATFGNAVQMVGTISGPTHPASQLQLDKQPQ